MDESIDATRRSVIVNALALALPARAKRPSLPLLLGDNSPREFVLRLLQLIADGGDFGWSLRFVPWARLLALSAQGEALAFGLSRNDERERIYAFSEPVFTNHVWIVVRAGEPAAFGGLDSLKGRSLCLGRGLSYGPAFEAARDRVFTVQQVNVDLGGRLRMLAAGRCDVVPSSHRSPDPARLEQRLRERKVGSFVVQRPPMHEESIHIVAAQDGAHAEALARVNAGIRARRREIRALVDSGV